MPTIEPLAPWDRGPERPRWTEILMDGIHVLIRPVRKEDAAAERAFIEALSPEARRNRFLGQVPHPNGELIKLLTDLDYDHDIAFAAVLVVEGKESFIGISRYSTSEDGSECEFAVTVLDSWQNKGLGTALMKHLIDVAKSRGILRMWSMDLTTNVEMRELAHHLGFERSRDPDNASQVIHSLWLPSAV